MDIRRLKSFIVIVDSGSITRAADILHLAQPALSQQLAALEDHFGQKLLIRSQQGVTMTDAGHAVYRHAQIILRQMEQAQVDVSAAGNSIADASRSVWSHSAALQRFPWHCWRKRGSDIRGY